MVLAFVLCHMQGHPQSGPQPPCGPETTPSYPELDQPPVVKFWRESELGREWKPPACTSWVNTGFSTLITMSARFRFSSEGESLLRHIGAISALGGMRYWSTTHKQWQILITSAHALSGPQATQRRQDFAPDEMGTGKTLYFEQVDNLSGKATYRMHIIQVSSDRLVFAVENVSIMRYLFVTLFRPGEMQSIYFLDRESEGVWRYYSMVRTGRNASRLAAGHESSSINRAVAFYRCLAGIPTDQEPPAAR